MRVVVALTQPPLAEGGAPGKCAIGLIRGLRSHGIDVLPVAARQHFARDDEPPADLGVETIPVARRPRGWRTRARVVHRPRRHLAESSFGERVRELAHTADALHLEEVDTFFTDAGTSTPTAAHLHFLTRRDRSPGAPWRREFLAVTQLVLAERAALRHYRHLVASSPLVAAELASRAPKAEVTLAPLSLDPDAYPQAPLDGPPVAGLIGTGSWPPTANALERLLTRIWPRVRKAVPDAELRVAGRDLAPWSAGTRPGVSVIGEVSSAIDFLQGLSVLAYPVERGSGMKVKVMEALASGIPVVTTRFGAEGIIAGEGLVVADDDDALALAVARLLADPDERRERGRAGRAAYTANHRPEIATEPLAELYRRIAG